MLNTLGDLHYQRVNATLQKTAELVFDAAGEFGEVALELAPGLARGVGVVAEGAYDTVSSVNHKALKVTFMANVFVNYMIHGGALSMIGRAAGGYATRYLAAILIGKLLPGVPITAIRENPWFKDGFFYVTKIGSIVRKGEREHDRNGSVNDMQFIDVLVTLMTGKDDPKDIRNFLDGIQRSFADQIRVLLWEMQGEDFENRVHQRRTQLTILVEELAAIERQLYYRDDSFYDNLIRAHNTCIRLRRAGFEHHVIDRMIELGDPTIMNWVRSYMFSLTSVLGNILMMPERADWWERAMREELSIGNNTNNPDYTFGAD